MSNPGAFLPANSYQSGGGLKRKKGQSHLALNTPQETFDLDDFQNEILPTDSWRTPLQTYTYDERPATGRQKSYAASEDIQRPSFSANPSSVELGKSNPFQHDQEREGFSRVQPSQSLIQNFIWPAFAICVPMVLLSAALLYIIFTYQVQQTPNLFDPQDGMLHFRDAHYILVDFSATKLVFLASFLSTLAPLLAGCIMTLAGMLVYGDLKKASDVSHFQELPTPYQMSLLIGIIAASYEQLLSTLSYLVSRKRTAPASPALKYAMSIFLLSVLLGVAVTITDAYLHVATQTVDITKYADINSPGPELGRGISAYCLGVNRVDDNSGYPCSLAANVELAVNPDFTQGQPEMERIAHNTSSDATMHLATLAEAGGGRVAYLLPNMGAIPADTNYKATTIGVSTKCSLIPPTSCNLTRWGDDGAYYSSFNCSSQFYGVLGMEPPASEIGKGKAISPYTSFLAINQNANLIYNYFADRNLEIVYNTADLNASALQTEGSQPWPDDKLQDTIFMGFAWRTAKRSFEGYKANAMVSSDLVQTYDNTSYVDYFLNCEVTSYNITYAWVNGSLDSLQAVKHDNGSVLNVWTGTADYTPRVTGSDWNLQDYNIQSVIAGNTTSSYEQRFGELISQDALATIGAYTSGRQVLQQQRQTHMLVAKVPKSALAALLACSLLYPTFGIILLVKAGVASREIGPITPLFSYWGLASAAFLETPSANEGGTQLVRRPEREEAFRLFIRNDDSQGYRFGLWRRSQNGHVTEIQRSQIHVASWL